MQSPSVSTGRSCGSRSPRAGFDWPDWSGETAVIVGTGPSAVDIDLEITIGRARVFAIKSSWRLAPWADALYGLDRGWWLTNKGVPEFVGQKFSPSPTVCRIYPDVREIRLKTKAKILVGETGVVGCGLKTGGGHSGFQALNLAVQFGAKRIVLVGFDMGMDLGAHWLPREAGVGKPDANRIAMWREALDGCSEQVAGLGVEVINASSRSKLLAYPKLDLSEALKWA